MTDAIARPSAVPAASGESTVVSIDPTTDERWTELLARLGGDVFHSPAWLRCLARTYELPIRANVLVDAAGAPTAGFVYAIVDDMMDPRVASLPFSDFCDPLVSTLDEWVAVSGDVVQPGRRVQLRCVHSTVPLEDPSLATTGRARWHGIDLARPKDEIWDGIASSARRSIRKAGKEGVKVRVGTDLEDVRAFFEIHLRVRKYKYGLLAQPWRFFEALWEELVSVGGGAVFLAYRDEELLGGVLFLEWQKTLYYKFNASDGERLGLRPNDLVIWHGIEHALDRGLETFDFGLSDWDQEGLLRFKRKYATSEETIHTLGAMPPGGPSSSELEMRALLPRMTELFTDAAVPDSVTERAGDALYRYFT